LTLSEAKTKCKLSDDCIGITKEKENYQLRAGPGAFSSNIGEKSWMLKLEKCNDELEGENRINIGYLEHSYEELKGQRFRRPDGKCVFGGNFCQHLCLEIKVDWTANVKILFRKIHSHQQTFGFQSAASIFDPFFANFLFLQKFKRLNHLRHQINARIA